MQDSYATVFGVSTGGHLGRRLYRLQNGFGRRHEGHAYDSDGMVNGHEDRSERCRGNYVNAGLSTSRWMFWRFRSWWTSSR